MDRALPADEPVVLTDPPADALAEEIRHSAFLLAGALGLMGLVAVTLLVLTTRFGG
jgi:hypothetical protein